MSSIKIVFKSKYQVLKPPFLFPFSTGGRGDRGGGSGGYGGGYGHSSGYGGGGGGGYRGHRGGGYDHHSYRRSPSPYYRGGGGGRRRDYRSRSRSYSPRKYRFLKKLIITYEQFRYSSISFIY